jgi:hypothetical protein
MRRRIDIGPDHVAVWPRTWDRWRA